MAETMLHVGGTVGWNWARKCAEVMSNGNCRHERHRQQVEVLLQQPRHVKPLEKIHLIICLLRWRQDFDKQNFNQALLAVKTW